MFGFSLSKLLVLAAIAGAVWYGFKWISRQQKARGLNRKSQGGMSRRAAGGREEGGSKPAQTATQDMVQCPACQAYVAARAADNCGRADCPY